MQRISPFRSATALLFLAAVSAHAQFTAAGGLGALVQRQGPGLWQSATRIDPAFRVDGRWAQLAGDASIVGTGNAVAVNTGLLDLRIAPPPISRFRLVAEAATERASVDGFPARTIASAQASATMRVGAGGAWLGLGTERALETSAMPQRPALHFGLWRQLSRVLLTVGTESHDAHIGGRPSTLHTITRREGVFDSLRGTWDSVTATTTTGDSGSAGRALRWSEVMARATWSLDRVSLDARIGVQPKVETSPASVWTSATATLALASRVALVASGGTQAARIGLGIPTTHYASLGVRIAPPALVRPAPPAQVRPQPAAFQLHAAGDGAYVISVRVPNARAVDISGDFSGWRAVALRETSPDVWEATLPLAVGNHRVNVRVNGDTWVAPPGLPAIDDDFNGTVGLLVVR